MSSVAQPVDLAHVPDLLRGPDSGHLRKLPPEQHSTRLSVPEIAARLDIGRLAVYSMLEQGIIPGIRLGRRWIITRHAYEQWERTCGTCGGPLLGPQHKVTVLT